MDECESFMKRRVARFLCVLMVVFLSACNGPEVISTVRQRADGSRKLSLNLTGSLQNPAFSPSGRYLLLTRFRGGYNVGPADLIVADLTTDSAYVLVGDGSNNVNLPGSCWNARTHQIVFSSSRNSHDEIFEIADSARAGAERLLTSRPSAAAYEPSYSPDGSAIVFESHPLDSANHGGIYRRNAETIGGYVALTDSVDDCRQPNWSPQGDLVVYQREMFGRWHLWTMNSDGGSKRQLTSYGNETDASFSPDGAWIFFSGDSGVQRTNIFRVPVSGGASIRVTNYEGYDGAPSVSNDGSLLAFESYSASPDRSPGTSIWLLRLR